MADKTQQESEAFVKAYELAPVVDSLGRIETVIQKLITEDALKLTLQPIISDISSLKEKDKNRAKLLWIIIPIVCGLIANFLWGLLVNSGRLS